jgi:hypothetical protein
MSAKLGRNRKCPCGSGKKYKVCCLTRQLPSRIEDQLVPFEKVTDGKIKYCMDRIKSSVSPTFTMADATDYLTSKTYRPLQLHFMKSSMILFAKKTLENAEVFASREETPASDIMIMYRGQYRTILFRNVDSTLNSLLTMF